MTDIRKKPLGVLRMNSVCLPAQIARYLSSGKDQEAHRAQQMLDASRRELARRGK